MKALILAAGYGTRLKPYTSAKPKPLFSINNHPLLDLTIRRLIDAGCSEVMINTHHLSEQIDQFAGNQSYPIPVHTRYEAEILGTGGAIKNLADFWQNKPFMVINSDIVCDADLQEIYAYHRRSPHPATLVMHDYPVFNSVYVDTNNHITRFRSNPAEAPGEGSRETDCSERLLAFTGIQVLDPLILDYIPENSFYSSIDAYRRMLDAGYTLNAYIPARFYWRDIGTPQSYLQTAFEQMATSAFQKAFPRSFPDAEAFSLELLDRCQLKGDGSDRSWSRSTHQQHSLVTVEHGIQEAHPASEAHAFIQIGTHLHQRGVPVPRIYAADAFSGIVLMQDLGDTSLQQAVQGVQDDQAVSALYQRVIDHAVHMHQAAAKGFDTAWTWQSPAYDKSLILEKECRYFLDAYVNDYAQIKASFALFEKEFDALADRALQGALTGFMHRDLQSRNIMMDGDQPYFIDFQGGRLGPLQYDLASLLIDPYVSLPRSLQQALLDYGLKRAARYTAVDPRTFKRCYAYCALARNLQMLGAFGYLSLKKRKSYFREYIPTALKALQDRLNQFAPSEFKRLKSLVNQLVRLHSYRRYIAN